MKQTVSVSMFFVLLAATVFFSCSGGKDQDVSKKPEGKSGKFTIVYSGNVGGKLNPCGCRIPLGGFARRATAIEKIRGEAENVLILDSGAMLYPHFYLYPPYDDFAKLTAHILAEVSIDSGIDARNVSSYDVVNSADSLVYFDNKYPSSKWLSANVVRKGSTEPIFQPDMVFDAGDIKVGVFGFMDKQSQAINIFPADSPLDVLDPFETAQKEYDKLSKTCDIVIGLAYMDLERVREVVARVPGINIIISSHTREHNPSSDHNMFQPVTVGDTIILRCPDGGRVLGRLDLSIARGSTSFADVAGYVDLRPEAVRAKDPSPVQSTYRHEFIDLGPDIERTMSIQEKINAFTDMVDAYARQKSVEYSVQ